MAIFPVRKTVMTSLAVALSFTGAALLAAGCSHSGHHAAHSSSAESDNAIASTTEDAADHGAHGDHHGAHSDHPQGVNTNHDVFHSKSIEVPAGTPVPAVSVRVDADDVRGWNLYVGTANFDFEPSKVNGESLPTEGHAHLYINDESVQRIYSTWTHLPTLPGGENEIRVTLNANSHETLTTQGEPIEDSVMVEVYDPNQAE